jgi:hypothetical protein
MRTRGDWRFVALFGVMALLFGLAASPVSAATVNVGQHIHVEIANHPVDTTTVPRAPYTFNVTLRAHDQTGRITSFRVSDYSTVKKTVSKSLGPCSDCATSFAFTVDFSSWSCGRHELRWTANVPDNDEGKRQFTTSRSFIMLAGCTTDRTGRPSSWHAGGGSWYEGRDYSVAIRLSPDTTVKPGGTVQVRIQSSATRGCMFLNPAFHDGSHGTQLGSCWTGTGSVSRVIPSTARVGDKLVIFATDGKNAGLLEERLGDGSKRSTAFHGQQSWWASTGLVLP